MWQVSGCHAGNLDAGSNKSDITRRQYLSIGSDRLLARNSAARNRAEKAQILLSAVVLVFGVSFGWTPAVPDTIQLPDSLGPIRPPYHLAFGSSTDNIYVASESADIMVVDGSLAGSFQRIKRISTGTPVGGALLVSQHNKLYCSFPEQGRIGIIDCATNSVVGSIPVGTRPTLLCYSSGSDKLYCGDTIDGTVSVIDCAVDVVLEAVPVGDGLAAMEYDRSTGKVYAGTQNAVRAISCSADSVVASIDAIKSARGFCVSQRRQKLYAAAHPYYDTLYVVNTMTDSLVARIHVSSNSHYEVPNLACNEPKDRLYAMTAGGFEELYEFDCVGDTLLSRRLVSDICTSLDLVYDSVGNRLYNLYRLDPAGCYLCVFDCTTLDVIYRAGVTIYADHLEMDPLRYRLMCTGGYPEATSLSVLDYRSDSADASGAVPLCGWMRAMFHNPATDRLYYWWGIGIGGVGVIDEETNRLVGQAFLSRVTFSDLTYSRTSNKVYFARSGSIGLGVIDGSSDSLIKVLEIGPTFGGLYPCWCPDENEVYCYAKADPRQYIAVVDCNTDTVVREIDVYDRVEGIEYLGQSRMLCVQYEHLTLIDSRTDSVLVDTAVDGILTYRAAHTGDGKKVYLLRNGFPSGGPLEVLSSSSLSLLATIDWAYGEQYGGFPVYSDTTRKLYWFSADSVLAIDAISDTVVARMATLGVDPRCACLDHTGRYLFCACYDGSLRVYDTQAGSLVGVRLLPFYPLSLVPSPERRSIYVGCHDVILVYSDAPLGTEESANDERRMVGPGASVVRGVLFLARGPSTSWLLDAMGRKVMDLRTGSNDVRGMPPGIYFIRAGESGRMRKIIIAR
jgi:DNA-binding beta-propeller fold protein YncE